MRLDGACISGVSTMTISELDWPDEARIDIIGPNGNTGEHYAVLDELKEQRFATMCVNNNYNRALAAHPDCRDPGHPGCKHCEDFHE